MFSVLKRLPCIVAASLLLGLASVPASANTDIVREMDIVYDVQSDGTVAVTWEIDWDFGEPGRHGIVLDLLTQQPWELDDSRDVVFGIDDIDVTSPTGAVTEFSTTRQTDDEFRFIEVRVGNDDEVLTEARHTYVVTYTIDGALRTFDDQPEFFWDVTSLDFVQTDSATVTVTSPSGVTDARCLIGDQECNASISGGVATMQASPVPQGETLSIVAGFGPGSITVVEPTLVDAGASSGAVGPLRYLTNPWISGAAIAALTAVLSIFYAWSGRKKDERFAGVPPGVMNHHGPVTNEELHGAIPVRFDPPEVPLSDAGLAWHRGHDSTILAATLIQMAVRGSIELTSDPLIVAQGDPSHIHEDYEQRIFDAAEPETTGVATPPTKIESMWKSFHKTLRGREGSILGEATRRRSLVGVFGLLWLLAWGALFLVGFGTDIGFGRALLLLFPGLVLGGVIAVLIVRANPRWRLRPLSARGSAIRDQTEGFRIYIETAEAHQLDFEAEQDIYRRYLPWAVLFGLTERWTKVCENLARMGRIAPLDYSFIRGARSASDVTNSVRRINTATSRARSEVGRSDRRSSSSSFRGGSGGRSGFRSRSRGGGGGGGSRSRSW